MMHKAWCSIKEVPYNFSRSSIKFQGPTGRNINDLDKIWARLLGRSQLSNPSDLPCYWRKCIWKYRLQKGGHFVSASVLKYKNKWNDNCKNLQSVSCLMMNMMTSSNGNIFRVTGPICGEFTGHRWIPRTKASDAGLWCFLWSAPGINGWVNNREDGDLRRQRAHYDVIVMKMGIQETS